MVLLVVGAAVVLFLLAFVVPRFAALLEHSGRELPLMSRWLMAWGSLVHEHGSGLATGSAVALTGVILALRRAAVRDWIADRILAMPGIGQHFRIYRQSQFFRTCAMLVDGGIPVVQAFELARGLIGRANRDALAVAMKDVRNGGKICAGVPQAGLRKHIHKRPLPVREK